MKLTKDHPCPFADGIEYRCNWECSSACPICHVHNEQKSKPKTDQEILDRLEMFLTKAKRAYKNLDPGYAQAKAKGKVHGLEMAIVQIAHEFQTRGSI